MPKYYYTGKTLDNKSVKGTLEASDMQSLITKLRSNGVFPLDYGLVVDQAGSTYRLKYMELSEFSREVSTLISSGITVFRALGIMKERDIKPKLKHVYEKLYATIEEGNTLADSMDVCGVSFPSLMINVYKAGEASGRLDQSAMEMTVYYEKEHKLRKKVQNAMTYPMLLLIMTVVIVVGIFTLILPAFFDLFAQIELPLSTRIILAISNGLTTNWLPILLITVTLLATGYLLLKQPAVIYQLDKFKLKIPQIGKLLRIIYTAQFARGLSSLYSSGLPILDAVSISSTVVANSYITSQFDKVMDIIRRGDSLSEAIVSVSGFDKKLHSTIMIGEETGKLDSMLRAIADSFDYESEIAASSMIALIEPLMIIFMAVIVGTIILSVMIPIMSIYQGVGAM